MNTFYCFRQADEVDVKDVETSVSPVIARVLNSVQTSENNNSSSKSAAMWNASQQVRTPSHLSCFRIVVIIHQIL